MARTSRDALAAARERFDTLVVERPDAAGLGGMAETLFATVSLLRRESALRRASGDPATRPAAKIRLLDSLFGEFDGQTLELLRGLVRSLSLIHISEPTRLLSISYAVFCLKKKK